jgi:hypothetical protein
VRKNNLICNPRLIKHESFVDFVIVLCPGTLGVLWIRLHQFLIAKLEGKKC